LIEESLRGYKIINVDATEDKIVYTGGSNHEDFVSCLDRCVLKQLSIRQKKSWAERSKGVSGKGKSRSLPGVKLTTVSG
jgi:hypothetical protein